MRRILLLLTVSMFTGALAFGQTKTVSGNVSDFLGAPLQGVSVLVPETNVGVTTNDQGVFSIKVPEKTKSLVFSMVGFVTQRVNLTSANWMSIQLQANPSSLEAVVVSAQGLKTTVKAQGVAQTTLNSQQLTNASPTNISSGLSGKVAGLQVSAIGSGINPTYRLVLRGMRSLLGNNEALVVLDNVIVPSSILGNLNPQDVDNITVLNGGSAAALYGSDGSNGALIITTKRGASSGRSEIKVSQNLMVERVAHMPKMQHLFGSGSDNDIQVYLPYENQQYGPRFDGSIVEIGLPLEDGSIQKVPYKYSDGKEKFWANGLTSQTDVSLATNHERGSFYISAQYVDLHGTIPGDKYNRASARINGTQKISNHVNATYSIYYIQNRYNTSSQSASIFNDVLNAPGQAPLNSYADWKTDPYANPNGYFNAYYNNPYFIADNYRSLTRNDYFTGNASIEFKPIKEFSATFRMGFNTRNVTGQDQAGIFKFSDYTKNIPEQRGTYKTNDVIGWYDPSFSYSTLVSPQVILHGQKKVKDFKFDLTGIGSLEQSKGQSLSSGVDGLVVPGLFNLGNSLSQPTTGGSWSQTRKLGVMGKLDIAFKNYLFVTVTGRNDWFSTLDPENWSFFYPSAQISFTPTDVIQGLKNLSWLDFLKVRAGWSKVGNVNIGAYSLKPTFGQSMGYPYAGQAGHTISTALVSPSLKPEMTQGYEAGFDFALLKDRIKGNFTYYNTKTNNQTLSTGISSATGFSSFLLNVGETSSKGVELSLTAVPVRTDDWFVSIGANYAYYDNKVIAINQDIDFLGLGGLSYAIAGQQFPVLRGTDYLRDPQGRIIVNQYTGYPSGDPVPKILGRASAKDEIGINLEVDYKGFTLAATASYRGGNYIYNGMGTTSDFSGAGWNTVLYERERFVIPNSVYEDPNKPGTYIENKDITVRDGGPGYWTISGPRTSINTNYITSAAFWKLREISLTYQLPNSWFANGRYGLKGAQISLQGRNLFYILPGTNVYTDPEYSAGGSNALGYSTLSQTPPSEYFGGTVTLKF